MTARGDEEEVYSTLYCTENLKQIFPEMNLRGLVPNYYEYIHVYVSDIYMNAEIGNEAAQFPILFAVC
jgi:hypothetical protein